MKELIQALINQGIITATDIQRMTTLELLLSIVERVNELQGMTKEGLEAVQRLLDQGVQEEVVAQLDEWLQDGTFDTLINQSALKKVNDRIDENDAQLSQLEAITNKIKNDKRIKFRETCTLYSNSHSTFENASSFNVVTNVDKSRVQVLGISPENDSLLATYAGRDSVSIYSNIGIDESNTMECYATSIGVDFVIVDSIPSDAKVGMIIETSHSPRYSALIKEIDLDNNKIVVYNWYQDGNTSKGQIPSLPTYVTINPITNIWNFNTNLNIPDSNKQYSGVAWELDILNQSDKNTALGIDIVNKGVGAVDKGIVIRRDPDKGKYKTGVHVDSCDTGLQSSRTEIGLQLDNANQMSILSNNSPVFALVKATDSDRMLVGQDAATGRTLFTEFVDGSRSSLRSVPTIHNVSGGTISTNGWFVLCREDGVLPDPSTCYQSMYIVHSLNSNGVKISYSYEGSMWEKTLLKGKSAIFYSDGGMWYLLDFNLS